MNKSVKFCIFAQKVNCIKRNKADNPGSDVVVVCLWIKGRGVDMPDE